MGIESWSTTAASNNAASPNGAPEGMAASGVNDTIRQNMASVRSWYELSTWINFGHTPTRTGNTTFTVATDLTALYQVGRRLKATGSATGYATISASSYSAPNTTVTVVNDSGNLPGTLSAVLLGAESVSNPSLPSLRIPPGSLALPSVASLLDTDTGWSWTAADTLSGSAGGSEIVRFDVNGCAFFNGIRWRTPITPTTITANQHNYAPTGIDTAAIVRLSSDDVRTITGILTATTTGRILILINVGANNINLASENASSTAANRFLLNGDTTLNPNEGCLIYYDSTSSRWRAILRL